MLVNRINYVHNFKTCLYTTKRNSGIFQSVLLSVLQVIRILKELKQKYPDKELDQLVELANYYALLHQQKSRAFYRIQVIHTDARAQIINSGPRGQTSKAAGVQEDFN